MDWLNLSVNIISGGLVGYITNSLAIKMLFKEYPVIGGGEVIKDRENLENAMSDLVEERLITPETVLKEFDKEGFKRSFEALILKIVAHDLKRNLERFSTLGEIEGYKKTVENLKQFLLVNREAILETTLKTLFDNVMVDDLLSAPQLKALIQHLYALFSQALTDNLKVLLIGLSAELERQPVSELISQDLIRQWVHNMIQDLHQLIDEQFKPELQQFLNTQAEVLNLHQLLLDLEKHIYKKSLAAFLGENSSTNTANHLLERLRLFLNSPQGQQILAELVTQVIAILKTVDRPISAFLNTELEQRLLELAEKNLPVLLDRLDAWVANNKRELNELVQDAINVHLRSENMVKHLTATIFSEQLTERYQVIENVLQEIREIAEQSTQNVVQIFARFLDHTEIKDLIDYLDPRFLDRKALASTVIRMVNNYLPRLDFSFLDQIFHTPIGELPGVEALHLAQRVEAQLLPYLNQALFEQFLCTPQLEKVLLYFLEQWVDTLDEASLSHLLPAHLDSYAPLIEELLASQVFRDYAQEKIAQPIPALIQDKRVQDLMTDNLQQTVWRKLSDFYRRKLDDFLTQFQSEKVGTLYQRLSQLYFNLSNHELFASKTREALVGFMIQMIRGHGLFQGRIKIVVKESFRRFSDQEMQQEMENFMGKELRPIALLGALLGAWVGGILSLTWLIPGLQPYTQGLWALLVFPLAFALTGVATNWLAIKMLFKPYYPKKIPFSGWNIPLTPGVFVKNKAALGDSMARFIDQKLLSKANMVEILERYHPKWKDTIKSVVSRDDYASVDLQLKQYTQENYDSITPLLLDLGFLQVNQNQVEIADFLLDEARALQIEQQDLVAFRQEISNQIDESQVYLIKYLNFMVEKYHISPYSFNHLLTPEIRQRIELWTLAFFREGIDRFELLLAHPARFKEVLLILASRLEPVMGVRLATITPLDQFHLGAVVSLSLELLSSESLQKALLDFIHSRMTQQFSGATKMGDIFEGRLIELMFHESDFVLDILTSYLLEMASNNKERIVRAVVKDIQRQGMLEVMLVNFGGVRRDVTLVVDVVVEQKLGPYLEFKNAELKVMLKDFILHELAHMRLYDLGIQDNLLNLDTIQALFKEKILNDPQTQAAFERLASGLLNELVANLHLQELLAMFNLHSFSEILSRFEDEIALVRTHLRHYLEKEKSTVTNTCTPLIQAVLSDYLFELTPARILQGIPLSELKQVLNNWAEHIYQTDTFHSIKHTLLREFFGHLSEESLLSLVSEEILRDDMIQTIEQLSSRKPGRTARSVRFQEDIKNALRDMTLNFVGVLNTTVETDTKVEIENLLVDSLIDGLRRHNREVLEPIDFDGIVRNEVQKMGPERIESLFDFAQQIFKALIMYGALGGIIGIVAGLMAALS